MPKNNQPPVFRTRIEQRFAELLAKEGLPQPGVAPLRGWLEEVIFDPAGSSHNGGGK
jgi:hypothetical protein